jgi:hypothetical protein
LVGFSLFLTVRCLPVHSAPATEEHEEQHQAPDVERPSILAMAFVWLMHGLLPRRAWHFNRYRRHRRARR